MLRRTSEPDIRASGTPSRGSGSEDGISLFLPAFNEEQNVSFMVSRASEVLERLGAEWEIIVVDDGSTDSTPRIVEELSGRDPRIRLVSHGRNLGFGMAVRSGISAARLGWVFYTDCDGQFDLDDLERFWCARDSCDIISGYRRRRRDPGLRLLYSLLYNSMAWVMFWGGFKDVDASFKLYRRSVFDRVRPRSTSGVVDLEILLLARGMGFRIRQMPVSHLPRRAGSVSFETFRHGFLAWVRISAIVQMFVQLVSLRLRTLRGDVR
ncbi:glycosyltransferase family 2 protein [Candidatus Fermentibacteria bacterium]|nr:glycosyltransferase family 2 protein [Candidatus Fermentibacteria bacterium]